MSGGTVGSWHVGAVRRYMEQMTGGDMSIEEVVLERKLAYVVRDRERPGMTWIGRTPKLAAQAAGCHITGLSR